MMKSFKKYILPLSIGFFLSVAPTSYAQDIIQIEPLFEYPSAPETLSTLTEKSNYLVEHFWDLMDFRSNTTVDQNALIDAMKVYSVPLRWADLSKAETATDKLIEKISKNPTLLTQFTKAAEEVLYGPRAEYWIDVVYMKFLDAYLKNKKIPETRKAKYQKQFNSLRNTLVGQIAPTFDFMGKSNKSERYMPMSTPTLIILGDPTLPDWRLIRLKMETSVPLRQAVDQGKLNIVYIVPFNMDNWENEVSNYPPNWTVGTSPKIDEILDLRVNPSVYYIGGDGKIVMKNVTIENAINEALNAINK